MLPASGSRDEAAEQECVTAGGGSVQVWGPSHICLGIQTLGWGSALAKLLGGRRETGRRVVIRTKLYRVLSVSPQAAGLSQAH